jgi:hypothetical protein
MLLSISKFAASLEHDAKIKAKTKKKSLFIIAIYKNATAFAKRHSIFIA